MHASTATVKSKVDAAPGTGRVPLGRRTRVLHVGPLPPAVGGMAVCAADYLRSEVAVAFDILALSSDLVGKLTRRGVARHLLNPVNALLLTVVFAWKLVTWSPALVHIQTNSYAGFFEKGVLAFLARVARKRVLLHVHGGAFGEFYAGSGPLGRRLIRTCLELTDRVIVLSDAMRQVLLATGVAPARIVVIANAVFLPESSVSGPSVEDPPPGGGVRPVTVLFLNRLEPAKGMRELVEAAALLCARYPFLRFRITGPESDASRALFSQLAGNAFAERIQLTGPALGADKHQAFLDADVYVLPSHVEGMPLGLLEAMSYGLACVATPVGAVPDVVQDGVNGLLVPVGDAGALAAALERLALDAGLRRRLGAAARRTVESRFNWQHRAREIIDLYENVLRAQLPR